MEKTAKGLHAEIQHLLPKGKKFSTMFDVGCGTGALLKRLAEYYSEGYGTDLNDKDFIFKKSNIHFKKSNFNEGLPFKDKKFELITCTEIIEHVENQFMLIRNISDRLSDKGIAIISSPNIYNIWSRFLFFVNGRFINFTNRDMREHINPLVENIFEMRVLKDAGLKIISKRYGRMHIPILNIYLPFRTKLLGNNVIYILKKR